jgi:hypothetical protein
MKIGLDFPGVLDVITKDFIRERGRKRGQEQR